MMWVFLTSRIRTWLVVAVAVPLAVAALRAVRRRVEARSGQTRTVRVLSRVEQLAESRRRGKRQP